MRKLDLLLSGALFLVTVAIQPLLGQSAPPASTPPVLAPQASPQAVPQAVPHVVPPAADPVEKPIDSQPAGSAAPPAPTSGKARGGKTGKSGAGGTGATASALRSEDGSAFIIGSEDVLGIRVWDEPNLSGPVTVGPDGMISLQLIHEVKASGLTTVQLEALLTERLKEYRNNPEVSVQVIQVRSRRYILQGGVARTGTFPLTGPTTILEALVNGGGFKEFSDTKKIYILRKGPDGKTNKIKFNYKEVSTNKHMEQNILVQNGDFIIVPE